MNAPEKIPVKHATTVAVRAPTVFGSLQREIDRLFDDFTPAFTGRRMIDLKCKMDLADTADGMELTVELPGLEEKDVAVTVADGILTVSGEKKFETDEKEKTYHFIERGYGAFARSIHLPEGVVADRIKATMSKGVLKVDIPAAAKAEPKKIAVQAAA
jgi:HSP20 family protein